MVFCFFGSMDEILSAAKAQCRGRVIAVKRDQTAHRFTVTRQPLGGSHGLEAACRRLEELGIPYELKRTAFRFDQPFRSLEDARRFLPCTGGRTMPPSSQRSFSGRDWRQRATPHSRGGFQASARREYCYLMRQTFRKCRKTEQNRKKNRSKTGIEV